ncbi:capsule assembly Wzi family protein [uncultured Sunxiuqinia sp.]|uniref:capsule assembly Wzi family protein n=1 Tax=uncultured Sunxiuqinia sp. TaxID=1573825 RepID=UPI002AA7FEC2|nr:capsule assembly Wzi family protein [uncultured Sunxiuqinia sp.]
MLRALFVVQACALIFFNHLGYGQEKTGEVQSLPIHEEIFRLSSHSIVNLNGVTPFWFYSNTCGQVEKSKKSGQYFVGELYCSKQVGKISMVSGIELINYDVGKKNILTQLFLNLRYKKLLLRIGKERFTIGQYGDNLSSGSMFISSNARPLPRIGIGYYDYENVPFSNGWLVFKGACHLVLLNDDRGEKGTDKPYLHEKFLYIKTNNKFLNLWLGMNHSVLMGGAYPGGFRIPVDFDASFFGKGSNKFPKSFQGEQNNAAGAHFGLFDFGAKFQRSLWQIQTWYQKPISDGSGLHGIFKMNHDKVIGVNLEFYGKRIINHFVFEYLKTDHQSGKGIPNFPRNSELGNIDAIEDYDFYLYQNYGITTSGISKEEFIKYLLVYINGGEKLGGRDNYYNNGMYHMGNSYHGNSIGTPLFFTESDAEFWRGASKFSYDHYFISNRVIAYHFGISGWFGQRINYRLLQTFSINKGSYAGKYQGIFNWNEQPNYFFSKGLHQNYFLFELNYFLKETPLVLSISEGWDMGQIAKSNAFQFSVSWML